MKMLVLALVSPIVHNSVGLHVSQFRIGLKPITSIKRVFSAEKHVLAQLTSFLLKNLFKRKKMLVFALNSLILYNSMRLPVSQCFHCVKTDNMHKTRLEREMKRFSAINVVFAEKLI